MKDLLDFPLPDFDLFHELCWRDYAEEILTDFNKIRTAMNGDKDDVRKWAKPWKAITRDTHALGPDDLRRDVGNGF